MSRMLQLTLYIVSMVQLTSSQPTYDTILQESDVASCGRMDEDMTQLMTAQSRIEQMLNQLHRDVAELKAEMRRKTAAG